MLLTSILLALPGSAPSAALAGVPSIVWRTPDALEAEWRTVRRLVGGGATRVREYGARGLERSACDGLVDLRLLAAASAAGLTWQNEVALREWARPALARVLISAHVAWRARHPRQAIGVGDVAQAGCGQIDPGTLTRFIRGDDARALLAAAVPVAGVPTRHAETLESGGQRVLSEQRVVGQDTTGSEPLLFVHVRRYRELRDGRGMKGAALSRTIEDRVRQVLASAELAIETEGVNAAGEREWRQHWVDTKHLRQAILVVTERRRPFQVATASDVRLAQWAPARPGEARSERRWTRRSGSDDGWRAWVLLEEGAHVTHMAGLDADLSYPMRTPARRFALDPAGIDTAATWDWFVTLVATADALGTPIDRIIVGAAVLPRLLREVPQAKESRLVRERILRIVSNHDDHHHVRLSLPSAAADARSLSDLARPVAALP